MRRGSRKLSDISMAEAFSDLRADYSAAKSSQYRRRRTGVVATGSGADWHYRVEADYLRLLEHARDMDRNDTVIGQLVDRAVTNTVQNGFRLHTDTGDEALDQDLKDLWHDWTHDPDQCDVMGELLFSDMEHLALRQTFVDGDIFALPLVDGQLQFKETHRCRTPTNTKKNVVHGVMLDENRKRLEYWFTKDNIAPYQAFNLVSNADRVAARDSDGYRQVFHVYNPKRVSQTRGVTALSPVFDPAGMFEDITFAAMVQRQVASCFAIFRKRSIDFQGGGPMALGPTTSSPPQADGTVETIQGIAPGMVFAGAPGEELEGFAPNIPGGEFFPHIKLILTLIGINLGMPLVMVLMDASETNFSGFRGAVDQARMGFRRNQKWFASKFHKHVYQWKVRQWIAENAAIRNASTRNGIKIFKHRWNPPTWPYIEPLKDGQADAFRLEKRLTSPQRLHAENGFDAFEILAETLTYNERAITAALEAAERIETATGVEVDWHELLTIGGVNPVTPMAEAPDEPDPPPAKKKETANAA